MRSLTARISALPPKALVLIIFYPLFLFYAVPVAWIKSLWAARVLMLGRWSSYMGFDPRNALNSLFYRTQWLNLDRYGRAATSPILGLGNYSLKNWFHISLPASYIYSHAGAVVTLTTTVVWSLCHLVWLDGQHSWWIMVITSILWLSSTSYAMAFSRQNYQMLGWIWLPLALYCCAKTHYELAAVCWFLAGLGGLTPIFFSVPITASLAVIYHDPLIMTVNLPALLYALFRFAPLLVDGMAKSAVESIGKFIGVTRKEVRYDREMKALTPFSLYFLVLYGSLAAIMVALVGDLAWLNVVTVLLFLLNQRFIRVADEESLIVIVVTVFAFTTLQCEPSWELLVIFWLVANPMGYVLSLQSPSRPETHECIPTLPPFDHAPLEEKLLGFFSKVAPASRVYFAFEDPQNRYKNLFDGFRIIHEPLLYVAAKKGIHLFPDWWAVAETNYNNAPCCWGRSIEAVSKNLDDWSSDYAVVYQDTGSTLEARWQSEFEGVAEFDWGEPSLGLHSMQIWPAGVTTPKLFLLKKRHESS